MRAGWKYRVGIGRLLVDIRGAGAGLAGVAIVAGWSDSRKRKSMALPDSGKTDSAMRVELGGLRRQYRPAVECFTGFAMIVKRRW